MASGNAITTTGTNQSRTLTLQGAGDIAINDPIVLHTGSGTGVLVKNGGGTVTLNGANTFNGTTTINNGTLSANKIVVSSGNSSLGNATSAVILGDASNQGTLLYTGGTANYTRGFTVNAGGGQLTNAGGAVLTVSSGGVAAEGLFTVGGASGNNITISSQITGAGGLTKTGANNVSLTHAGGNTYSGGTIISGGAVTINDENRLGANVAGNTLTIENAASLNVNNVSVTLDDSNRSIILGAGNGALGPGGTGVLTVAIPISGSSLLKYNTGTLVITGNNNTYTGFTQINNGTMILSGGDNRLPTGTNVNIGAGNNAAILQLDGIAQTIAGLTKSSATASPRVVGGSATEAALIVNLASGSSTYDGQLGGVEQNENNLSFTKDGAGTLTLTGVNSYSGATTVSAGSLLINGNHSAATGDVTVAPGATLGGTGVIGGHTTIQGTHSPGNSPGIQTFVGNLTYQDGGTPEPTVNWELIGNTVTNAPNPNALFDTIIVGGDLDFEDATSLSLIFDSAGSAVDWTDGFWASSHTGTNGWLLYDVAGATSNFNNLSLTTTDWLDGNGASFDALLAGANFSLFLDGNNIYLEYSLALVPEPGTMALLAVGLLGLLAYGRCRRRG